MYNKDREFYYNEENYLLKLKPNFERDYFNPRLIVQFGLVLPYSIPFPEGSKLSYKVNSEEVCHFLFTSISDKKTVFTGDYSSQRVQVDIKRTRVEVNYIFKEQNNNLSEDTLENDLTEVFDKSLEKLNNIIVAYIAKTKDVKVHKLNKENFDMALLYRISNGENYKELFSGLLILHMNAPDKSTEELSHQKTNEIMNFIDVIGNNLNPFVGGQIFLIEARKNFSDGNYRQAITNAQTFVENSMYSIYRGFLKQENFTKEEITTKSNNMRYKSLIIDQFHTRIGGEFVVDNCASRVGKWWSKTYLFRNKVVHEGYYLSFDECEEAIYHATDVIEYIFELIYKPENKQKYSDLVKHVILNP